MAWLAKSRVREAGEVNQIDTYDSYRAVDTLQDVLGEGDRIYQSARVARTLPEASILSGAPGLPLLGRRKNPGVPVRLVRIEDALVLRKKQIVNLRTGKLILDSFRRPANGGRENRISRPDQLQYEKIDLIISDKATPVLSDAFCAISEIGGFGHILREGISQLWPLTEGLRPPAGMSFLVNRSRLGTFHHAYLEALAVGFTRLVPVEGPLRVKGLVVAYQSFVLDHGVGDHFFTLAAKIADHFGDPPASCARLYVSRRHAGKRRLVNELAVETLFERHGFRVVYPEQLPVSEQCRLFAGAKWVAGPVGSGLYGAMFCRPDTRRIILAPSHFFTVNDLLLSRMHAPMYLFGNSRNADRKEAMSDDWEIDEASVARNLGSLFRGNTSA
ncbi:MAG: glycosyltransferase family 61 protein [Enhydrobacter sp.]|nr:glycosyltransferase family 61 protein [Enhydrobacter sp.]